MLEQALLAHALNHRSNVLRGMRIVDQESPIPIGKIDLIAVDGRGKWAIIEVKVTLHFDAIGQVMAYAAYFALLNDIEVEFLRKIVICAEAKPIFKEVCQELGIEVIVLKKVEKLPRPKLFRGAVDSVKAPNLLMFACNKTEYKLLTTLRGENMRDFRISDLARLAGKPVTSMPFYLGSMIRKGFIEKVAVGQYHVTDRVWNELSSWLGEDSKPMT